MNNNVSFMLLLASALQAMWQRRSYCSPAAPAKPPGTPTERRRKIWCVATVMRSHSLGVTDALVFSRA